MPMCNIILVAGLPGAGKTTWIREQQQARPPAHATFYLNLGAGSTPIDSTYLAAEMPSLTVLSDGQLSQLAQLSDLLQRPSADYTADYAADCTADCTVYVELGFHIDLASLTLPAPIAHCQRIAVLPPGNQDPEWQGWADQVVTGAAIAEGAFQAQLWRSGLTGQVLDSASLMTVWDELVNGAYGHVQRAKGIFDVEDGRSLYFDFVAGVPPTAGVELDLPLWFNGRPERFSGLEIVGAALEQEAIAHTLKDCCLEEQVIAYYQEQIKQSLESSESLEPLEPLETNDGAA